MFEDPKVCILPVAGLSTRNLPATKALHKGFLTLDSLPIIQYAVDCCAEIGIEEIVFIYSDQSCRHLFETYFKQNEWLENHLKEKNKLDILEKLRAIIPPKMKFSFAAQQEPKGTGHAVLQAKDIVGKRNFVVMYPDDVYVNLHGDGILKQLLDVYHQTGGVVENVMKFPREQMVRYGAFVGATPDAKNPNIIHATGMVEKPRLEEVPSEYASMGPYILPNEILDVLPTVTKGSNGEINLTDAINVAVQNGMPLTGVLCDVERFDCGTNEELVRSNLRLSLMKNKDLREYAKKVLDELD